MEDFVSYEIAVKLKKKGFKEQCLAYYSKDSNFYYNASYSSDIENAFKSFNSRPSRLCGKRIDAPTISQVLKCLREEKKIHIVIDITNFGFISSTISFKWDKSYCENEIENYDHKGYNTYEEASLAGIKYVVDNLI